MKKYAIYIGLVVMGLLLGWLFFGNSSNKEAEHNHKEAVEANQMWTCSMHPQIMQPEPGDCPICGMDLIPAEAGADGLSADEFKLTENAMKLANIETTVITDANESENSIVLSGKIVENEKKNAVQVTYFSGRIEKLFINFTGERIRKGQQLATIYSPELFAAQQELLTTSKLKESQPQLYKAVRNKLKLWKLSEAQINSIESSGKVIENFPVYATVSGTVTEKMVEIGQSVKLGQGLFKIADLQSLWAEFDVYESQVKFIKTGQNIEVSTNTQSDKAIISKVSFIDPVLNTKTRTVTLRVDLNNSKGLLKPGMFVKGKLNAKNENGSLLVPSSAVLWTGKRSVVYVKTKQDQAIFEMREVQIGSKIGESYQVLEGLKIGDEVVTNGAFTVDAAAQLQGKKSMMNKSGGTVMTGHEGHLGMNHNGQNMKMTNERVEVDSKFQEQLKTVFDEYIILKDALIKGDSKTSTQASSIMLKNLAEVDMKLLKGDAHNSWMQLSTDLKTHTRSLNSTADIKTQRNHFKPLSSSLIMAIEKFGVNMQVYSQFCPMADNNTGGYWLSLEDKVLNPYFGDAMLKCGEVTKTIK
ncbi:efflux RND transporter periplasmic adaptor subunit [Pseudotenacibaculum sp. MALMAid0570]|uniref:efflux RND transporter periplasmic adaptor subunit n=1 Tax=Pseudotenacibaculum sp. MALMAid0570 TaxID=3143938 RepID=UPI0032DE8F12